LIKVLLGLCACKVAVLIVATVVAGLVLWMARDSIRPFILGLLFVYLLDPPVRWLVRRGVRRIFAILIVFGVIGVSTDLGLRWLRNATAKWARP